VTATGALDVSDARGSARASVVIATGARAGSYKDGSLSQASLANSLVERSDSSEKNTRIHPLSQFSIPGISLVSNK
jgi:hypothetical protein